MYVCLIYNLCILAVCFHAPLNDVFFYKCVIQNSPILKSYVCSSTIIIYTNINYKIKLVK